MDSVRNRLHILQQTQQLQSATFLRFEAVLNLSPEMPSSCKTFAMSFVLMPQLFATFLAQRL